MQKPKKVIVPVSSTSKLKRLLANYRGKTEDLLIICENYQIVNEAKKHSLDYLPFIPFKKGPKFGIFLNAISKTTKAFIGEKNIFETFLHKNENFASMFERRLISFVGQTLANFEFINELQKEYFIKKIFLVGKAGHPLVGTTAMHESLLDFSLQTFAKIRKIQVSKINEPQYPAYTGNFLKKFILFYEKRTEIAKYLVYKYLKNQRVSYRAKILFVVPGSHIPSLIPLIEELSSRGFDYLVIGHNLTIDEKILLLKSKINFIERDDLGRGFISEARNIKHKINSRWKSRVNEFKPNFNDYLTEILKKKTENIINFEIENIICDYLVAKSILSKVKPNILVSTTDPDTKILPYIRAAKNAGVKTLTIQHGAFAWPSSVDFESDKMLVWGNYYKRWFKKNLGKASNQMEITGSVFFDKYKSFAVKNSRRKMADTILILLTNYYLRQFELENDLVQLIDGLRKFSKKIIVRTHPFQKVPVISLLSASDPHVSLINDKPLNVVIESADVVVSSDTTAGADAVICGKPVIYWPFYGAQLMPFAKYKVAKLAKNWQDILEIIRTYNLYGVPKLDPKLKARFNKDMFFRLDGLSYTRVVDRISDEIKTNR